ncbi:MAG: acetyl-CoA carboxylase carboxyl transferase subunit alpha, partial [Myxococcales bacterium]|nr:acetyl-CoA carboxylase carboxyl transferase subunit alpha [Myxococcales bacterium]
PEGCASILWQDSGMAEEAAKALKFRALELFDLGVVDDIIKEPMGGAHRSPVRAAKQLKKVVTAHLERLRRFPVEELIADRYEKYRRIGLSSLS